MCLIECVGGDFIFFSDISKLSIRSYKIDCWYFIFTVSNTSIKPLSKNFKSRDDALDWLQEVYNHQKDPYIYTLD